VVADRPGLRRMGRRVFAALTSPACRWLALVVSLGVLALTFPDTTHGALQACVSSDASPLSAVAAENDLGCPIGSPYLTQGTQQPFQGGEMLWRADMGQVYVLLPDRWISYADEYRPGDPEPEPLGAPEPGLLEPRLGFGKIWRALGGPTTPLGWATAEEQGFQAAAQDYQNGTVLQTGLTRPGSAAPLLYAIHADGDWTSTAPTAMLATSPPFRFGMFEDFNLSADPARVRAIIRDLRRRGFDSIMWTNGSVGRQDTALNVSDQLGMDMLLGPATELNTTWWWDRSAPETMAEARKRLFPLIDQLMPHPSLLGYYIADEPTLDLTHKAQLAVQAFRERDPSRPAFPVLIGLGRASSIFDLARPDVMVLDVYPVAVTNPPCDFTMTGFGYRNLDFVTYLREITRSRPATTPLWVILQTHGLPAVGLREPSVEEVRKQFWLAVGEGAQGVFWFIYSSQQGWTGLEDNRPL